MSLSANRLLALGATALKRRRRFASISTASDQDVTSMSERERMRLRRETVAYIFQSFGLLPVLSAAENVGVPLRIAGVAPKEREQRVALMLSLVGLAGHARQRPGELSGG